MMHSSNCGGRGCMPTMIAKILLIIGGINWGFVGVGMLMGSDWNCLHRIIGSMPTLEAVVYVLVGLAAIMSLFHCKCKKCMNGCDGTCGASSSTGSGM